jgi:hypothetical protein
MMRHNSPPLLVTSFALLFVGAVTVAHHMGGLWGPLAVFSIAGAALIQFYILVKNDAIIRDDLDEARARIAANTAGMNALREGLAGVLAREAAQREDDAPGPPPTIILHDAGGDAPR